MKQPENFPTAGENPMLELARETLRFSWALSLFGTKQMAGALDPKRSGAAGSLSVVTDSIVRELGATAGQIFQAGDEVQEGMFSAMSGVIPGGGPRRAAKPAGEAGGPREATLTELDMISAAILSEHLDGARYEQGGGSTAMGPFTAPAGPAVQSVPPPDAYPFTPSIVREGRYVDVLGSRMHYIEQGTGDPILFLHGNPTYSYVWRNVIPHLSKLGRCIAPDLIGMGFSYKPDLEYTFFDHARFLDAFIAELGLRNVTLVMEDWGTALGFFYTLRNEDNVKGLAFMEGVIMPRPSLKALAPQAQPLSRLFRTPNLGMYVIVGENVFVTSFLPNMVLRKLTNIELANYRIPFISSASRWVIWQWAQAVSLGGKPPDVTRVINEYNRKVLQQSDIPKLLLYVDPGVTTPAKDVEWSKANMKNLETVFLGPGAHILTEDYPDEIGETIASWYRRLSGAQGETSS